MSPLPPSTPCYFCDRPTTGLLRLWAWIVGCCRECAKNEQGHFEPASWPVPYPVPEVRR